LKTAVVILNWNGKGFLEKFLPSVSQNSRGADLWVIDNDSTDDSVAFIKSEYPSIKIVQNSENGGFAKGYNDGLKHIEADIYVLLNSDVEVTAEWLTPLLSLMEADPTIAACQPKVKAYHNKKNFEHAGAAGGFMDKHGYTFCRGRIFAQTEEDLGQYDDSREIFWATGACMFIRSEDYHRHGGLDEDFFAHMEEIDLCWRLKNEGRKIWYCSESTVYHVGGGTLTYSSPRKTFLNFRNNLYTIAKNYRSGNLFIKICWRLCLDGLASVKFLFSFQFGHIFAVAKAHFNFYAKLGSMLKKRKALGKNLNINNEGTYDGGIVWQAFAKGNKIYSDLE
jgi:GT2 family glycosyltransferase